ncbi:MAG: tyrosine-protein phosphatase [Actinomycetota bacterium]|nr:tyrosine-protein phosphatase [Actinomycetota bacterium]
MRIIERYESPVRLAIANSAGGGRELRALALSDVGELPVEVIGLGGDELARLELPELPAGSGHATPLEGSIHPNRALILTSTAEHTYSFAANRIELEGATNFRDFGGYRRQDGGSMPWRRFFRSENLSRITAADIAEMRALGIRKVFDLRRPEEVALSPTPGLEAAGIEVVTVPISGTIAGYDDGVSGIFEGRIPSITAWDMIGMYESILENHLDDLLSVASEIAASPVPTLVHCTAGKDRTGLAVALVQLAHGASRQDIFYDYLLSNRLRTPVRMATLQPEFEKRGLDITRFKAYFSAPFAALESVYEDLEAAAKSIRTAAA